MESPKANSRKYFEEYMTAIGFKLPSYLKDFDSSQKDLDLGYQVQASAVYSSNIEGNSIDLNSFMNYKLSNEIIRTGKELQEIEDLISAYKLAQVEELNQKNFLTVHKILSKTILIASQRGKYRNDKVGVFSQSGLVYLAVEAEFVGDLMNQLFEAIEEHLTTNLSVEEVFYFAALIHLKFVHIHPFRDGNGRAARLLEKWFVAMKLGKQFWKLSSEKFYKDNQVEYYKNINLGVNYYELDYDRCIPFLSMLPQSFLKGK